jgi:hypothetical protein
MFAAFLCFKKEGFLSFGRANTLLYALLSVIAAEPRPEKFFLCLALRASLFTCRFSELIFMGMFSYINIGV